MWLVVSPVRRRRQDWRRHVVGLYGLVMLECAGRHGLCGEREVRQNSLVHATVEDEKKWLLLYRTLLLASQKRACCRPMQRRWRLRLGAHLLAQPPPGARRRQRAASRAHDRRLVAEQAGSIDCHLPWRPFA